METNATLIRSFLLYKYKLGTKAVVAAPKTCTASSGDLCLTDKARSKKPKIINNENLKQIEKANSNTTCLELAERFNVNHKIICLRLPQVGDTWKFSKWIPHELSSDNTLSRPTLFSKHLTQR
ncbi:hypothetical protein Trydic_g16843 [Trypoxylus dichotomus]